MSGVTAYSTSLRRLPDRAAPSTRPVVAALRSAGSATSLNVKPWVAAVLPSPGGVPGGVMDDESLDEMRQTPTGWALEQEMEVAAEVYGPEPKGLHTPHSELSDEELLERYRALSGFDLTWE